MSESPNVPPKPSPTSLADLLLQHGVVSPAQLDAARAHHDGEEASLIKSLLDLGFVLESSLISFLVKHLKVPHLNLQDYQINVDIVRMVPGEICQRFRLLPIDKLGNNLTLAMVNPLDARALDAVREACPGFRLKPFLCSTSDFERVAPPLFAAAPAVDSSDELSLNSLGLSAKAANTATPSPPSPRPSPNEAPVEPTATMLIDAAGLRPGKSAAPLRSSLICLDGWELGREIELSGKEHTLGRSPDADTTVNSPLVSREHARFTRNEEYGQETFVITDLKSSNGTFVNNIPITTTILRHGDRVMLGNVLFKFVLLDEIEARFHKDVHHLYSIHKDTGLLPAEAWDKELERALSDTAPEPVVACLIDIDNLQAITQSHGHIASVIVMADIGDMLEHHLDKVDLPGDVGDPSISVLFRGKPMETAFPILEDLRRLVEAHVFHHKEETFRTTISVGVAAIPRATALTTARAQLRRALDGAIESGRNTVFILSQTD